MSVVANPDEQPYSVCLCGARGDALDVTALGQNEPTYVAGALREPCQCRRCFTCTQLLDDDGRCETLDCLNLGLQILIDPDPEVRTRNPWTGSR